MQKTGFVLLLLLCSLQMSYGSVELNTARIAYYNERDYDRAIAACLKGVEKGERHWELYSILGGSRIGLLEWSAGADALIEAFNIDSMETFQWMQGRGGSTEYYYQGFYFAAREQYNQQAYDTALVYLDYAQYIDPTKLDIYVLRGAILYEQGQWEEANREYLRALSLDPENPDINYLIGKSLFEEKQFDSAGKYFKVAAESYSTHYERSSRVVFQYVEKATDELKHELNRLWKAQQIGQLDGFIKDTLKYEEGFDIHQKMVEQFYTATNDLARAYYFTGMSYYYIKEYASTADFLRKTLALRPDDIDALYFMGEVLVNQGLYDEALPYFKRLTDLKSDDLYAWFYLGVCYTQLKHYKNAADVYENKVLVIDPEYTDAMYNLAFVYSKLGNSDKSLFWLRKAESRTK
jgi:tetratricopeptide (TPR) repeat protein